MKKISNSFRGIIFIVSTIWVLLVTPVHADTNATSTSSILSPQNTTSTPAFVNFHIRYQDTLVFDGQAQIPSSTSTTVTINDDTGAGHTVNAASVLNVLNRLDQVSSAFAISDLQYFSSFASFFLNCIQITNPNVNACGNWQYVVNGVYPLVGMDQYIVIPGNDVYLYFGNQHQVILNPASVPRNQAFIATAQNYQYTSNTWGTLTGITIGVTQTNPSDPFSPIVIATSTVNSLGQATFHISQPGNYNVGIAEDFYFPSTLLTVTPQAFSTTALGLSTESASSTASQLYSSGGGGGGAIVVSHNAIDLQKAVQYIINHKNANDSYGSLTIYNDWVAIAFGAYGGLNSATNSLKQYLLTDPSPGTLITDYERRAMALMSLGISPYNGTPTNYIQKIVSAFDGKQIGDPNLVNDDIFSLFPLLRAGYTSNDLMIMSIINFILIGQQSDGSWVGGVDMTAAAIQALSMVNSSPSISAALLKAKVYLLNQQDVTGAFSANPYSTTWAMQGIHAFGEDPDNWQKNNKNGNDYLFINQAQDGGIGSDTSIDNRIWLTSYSIPAALKKSWGDILLSFSQPQGASQGFGSNIPNNLNNQSTQTPLAQQPPTSTNNNQNQNSVPLSSLLQHKEASSTAILVNVQSVDKTQYPGPSSSNLISKDLNENNSGSENSPISLSVRSIPTVAPLLGQNLSGFASKQTTSTGPFLASLNQESLHEIAGKVFAVGLGGSLVLGLYLLWIFIQSLL